MATVILNGKEVAKQIREEMKVEANRLTQYDVTPGLAVVLVGDDLGSQIYVRNKQRTCDQLGFYSQVHRMHAHTSQQEVLRLIHQLNDDARIHGILVQLPLPHHIDDRAIIGAICIQKDVDGFHPMNIGNLAIGNETFVPCTPAGIVQLIKRYCIELCGKHAVVIGRSNIVGKPVSLLLQREDATVTMCHSRTPNVKDFTIRADIIVAAIGSAHYIDASYVKRGAVVIDVGINRTSDGKFTGDVDFHSVYPICSAITPVPGGVGPMTITMLMHNTLLAAKRAYGGV